MSSTKNINFDDAEEETILQEEQNADINNTNANAEANAEANATTEANAEANAEATTDVNANGNVDADVDANADADENPAATNIEYDNIMLQLGDIIVIQSPGDYILDKKTFYIDYIDKTKIRIINVEDYSSNNILLNDDGSIADKNIKSITIISSNPNKGYARQNNLLPNEWIDILFSGDIPTIITGQITNLEDDMIEIKTIDNSVLYINFNYQGIPENLPPMSFQIRKQPTSVVEKESTKATEKMPTKHKTDTIILNDNDFTIGDIVQIDEIIEVDDSMRRYNIEDQTNDFFENLVSTIPNNKRNSTIINQFNTIVKRFVELRQMSSKFDKYGNVEGLIVHSASDIPLADYLTKFKNNLHWIKFGVANNRIIYKENEDSITPYSNIKDIIRKYSKGQMGTEQNNYYNFYNTVNSYMLPFNALDLNENLNVFSKPEGLIISRPIADNINAIDNTMPDITSVVIRKNRVKNRRFITQQYNTGLDWYVIQSLSKGGKMTGKKEKLTPNEMIHVNSIFTLPEPFVRFSQVNLPNSNLLTKANLSQTFVNYFEFLNKTTPVKNIILNDLENVPEIISTSDDYLNNEIKKFSLNLSSFKLDESITDMAIFHQFIKLIVPSTSNLFRLINKYIYGTLSPQNAILYLEPFMIYSNDLTFTQYKNISKFVMNKIVEYNDMFVKYEEIFNSIKNSGSSNIFQSNIFLMLNDLNPEELKSKNNKNQSQWVEFMSTKYNRPYWQNKVTGDAVWTKPDELKDEQPDIQINFFNEDMRTIIYEMYEVSNATMNISSSEIISKFISHDYGNLFNSLIAYTNLKLMFSNKLSKLFEEEKEILKQIIQDDRAKNNCNTYIIAKKYYSFDALINDNNMDEIYFDREYDTTNYDIVDEKFQREKNSMTKEEFQAFLTEQVKKIYKLNDENAIYLSETLTNGLKKVLNGHYAILSASENGLQKMSYYIRNNGNWEEVKEDLNLASFVKDNDILCNINYSCLYDNAEKTDDKCQSTEVNQDNIIENQFKGILDQFDEKYEMSMNELALFIRQNIIFNESKFRVLINYYKNDFLKYNNNAYKLGRSLNTDELITVTSPYVKLRDLILGQNDYAKKQQNIIVFIDKYCRRGISTSINSVTKENETEWWFYCRETNSPLIPYFRYELAKTFVENPQEYEDVLQKLIKEIGKQSDDGDSWVDKNSGEVICKIDFDFSEGFTDGFVNKSREIIESTTDEIVASNLTAKKLEASFKIDKNTMYLNDVFTVLEGALGVQLNQHKEFILKIGTSLLRFKSSDNAGILLTEKEYVDKMTKKSDKKPLSYELYYSKEVLYLGLALFAIGLQITIPSVKTRKIAPRCTKSFDGYPLGDSTDMSFIKYIVCAIKTPHPRDRIPWQAVGKDEDKMVPLVTENLDRYLLNNTEIREKIIRKIEYLKLMQNNNIPDEYSVANWINFLPPLKSFHISSENKTPVGDGFLEDLNKNILNANSKQDVQINVMHSKIIYQSLAIQEEIQKIINKKELIMKSSTAYHMVNSCCNNITDNITALQYFMNESPLIASYNNQVETTSKYLSYMNNLCKPSIYMSDVNTKSVFPEVPNIISEENIYRGFITYCKFNTLGGLSKELLDICIEKPNYIGKGRSIQEQIFQLKKMGRDYKLDDFLNLYKVVSRNNIISVNFTTRESPIDELVKYVPKLNKTRTAKKNKDELFNSLSEEILNAYSLILDPDNFYKLYEQDTQEMKNIKNLLELENDKLSSDIFKFIEMNKGTNSRTELNAIKKFIENIRFSKWEFNSSSKKGRIIQNDISNDKLYNYNNYMSNFIKLFSNTLPEAIQNSKKYTLVPHKYWKLSKYHGEMITKSVSNYYSKLNKFYGNLELASFLLFVGDFCKTIVKLTELTTSMSNIKKNGELRHTFDEEISSFLYEYYLLCIFKSYIILTNVELPYIDESKEQQYIDLQTNKKSVAELFVVYFNFMINAKKEVNISYDSVFDSVFKNREFEKNLVTDRLANMTQDERDIDTTLKIMKLGMYSIGQSKALRFYDEDQFLEDKKRNDKIAELEKKSKKPLQDEVDIEDAQYEADAEANDAEELRMNEDEDYWDGDAYGDERDDRDNDYE